MTIRSGRAPRETSHQAGWQALSEPVGLTQCSERAALSKGRWTSRNASALSPSQTVPELPSRRARTSPTRSKIGNTIQDGVTPSTIHETTAKTRPSAASASNNLLHASAEPTRTTVSQHRHECHVGSEPTEYMEAAGIEPAQHLDRTVLRGGQRVRTSSDVDDELPLRVSFAMYRIASATSPARCATPVSSQPGRVNRTCMWYSWPGHGTTTPAGPRSPVE